MKEKKYVAFIVSLNMLMFCDDDGLVVVVVWTLVWIKMIGYVSWWPTLTFKLYGLKSNVKVVLEVGPYS
jgi:hypothetical protein